MKNLLNDKPDEIALSARMQESLNLIKKSGLKEKKVLDIGCGYGWFEYHLIKEGANDIWGIEISDEDIQTAKNNVKDKRAKFKIGGALDIPLPNSSFDIAVAWEVIEHIPKNTEMKMFSEVYRILKPGGIFVLSTPYDSYISKWLDPAWWLIGHRHYSEKRLTEFAENSELKIVKFTVKGNLWNLLGALNMYTSKWILRRSPIFQNFYSRKEREEYTQKSGCATIFATFKKQK